MLDRTDAEGAPVSLDAGATDLDGDPLTYAATNLPAGPVSINTGTGLITGTIAFSRRRREPVQRQRHRARRCHVDATDTFTWTVTDATPRASPVVQVRLLREQQCHRHDAGQYRVRRRVTTGDLLLSSITIRGTSTITAPAGWTLIRNDLNGDNLRQPTWWRFATAERAGLVHVDLLGRPAGGRHDPRLRWRRARRSRSTRRAAVQRELTSLTATG